MAWEPKTLRAALAPLFWLNWICGLSVFEVVQHLRIRLTISYNLVWLALYVAMFISVKGLKEKWTFSHEVNYISITMTSILVTIFSAIIGLVNTEKLKNIIARWEQIDNTLEPFGIKRDYKKTLRHVICAILAWSMLLLCLYAIDTFLILSQNILSHGMYISILLYIPLIINSVVILSFCVYIRIANEKLGKINLAMTEVLHLSKEKYFSKKCGVQPYMAQRIVVTLDYGSRQYFSLHFLQIIRHVHLEIIRISRELNEIYCYQLLFQLISEFALTVGTLYMICDEVMQFGMTTALGNITSFAGFLWTIVNCTKIIIVNNFCTNLQRQARVTPEVLQELRNSCSDHFIKDEMEQFSLQIILHPLYISAGSFIFFNNRLTTVFFGTVTTYVAILIQMVTPSTTKS